MVRPMIYRLGQFDLDAGRFELRKDGAATPVEPQVLAVLLLLVERRDALVTRDELIERVWNGRIVSDSAIASRIKSARRALGDDGVRQHMIRTVHGRGFRFVGEVQEGANRRRSAGAAASRAAAESPQGTAKPSIAVLPFQRLGAPGQHALIADALPHDLITALCRLRWLRVIARGSSFRLRDADAGRVGALLGVRYCLSGSLEATGRTIAVSAELADTGNSAVLWSERYVCPVQEVHEIRARILASVTAALEIHIPFHEACLARLGAPERLDAWSAYHLGLQHMFRFNEQDNRAAAAMFRHAVAKEPDFARAHAGLSFTHFQSAFLKYGVDPAAEAALARSSAERAIQFDPLDPFVNFAMGRSLWLEGDLEASLGWLGRATDLSPNYAQGIYATAWTETLLGRGGEGQEHADRSMALSPIDPLHYAMLATRALSHLVRGEDEEAAAWADRAASAPGAHVLIEMIASACQALRGDSGRAEAWADKVRRRGTGLGQADFFRSFPFHDAAIRRRLSEGFARHGL